MLPTFVIGLREGIEASLIVGIIAAFLIQRGEQRALRPMWIGVGLATALCAAAAVGLRIAGESLPFRGREILEGSLALFAVGCVTYMVVWMRRHSRELKHSLEAHAEIALVSGSVLALAVMAFFAVIREGLETAVFLLAAFQNSSSPTATGLGAVLGIAAAVVLGFAIYRGGVRINLARFFRVTGFVLVLVAAGLLASAIHSFAEAGVVTALQERAIDLSWLVRPGSVRGSLITGMLGFQPIPTGGGGRPVGPLRDPDGDVRLVAAAGTPDDDRARREPRLRIAFAVLARNLRVRIDERDERIDTVSTSRLLFSLAPAAADPGGATRTGEGLLGPKRDGPRRSTGDARVWGRRERLRGESRPVSCSASTVLHRLFVRRCGLVPPHRTRNRNARLQG